MSHDDHASAQPTDDPAPPTRVLRAVYANAMREVLENPHKAVAEHEPWLLALLPSETAASKD